MKIICQFIALVTLLSGSQSNVFSGGETKKYNSGNNVNIAAGKDIYVQCIGCHSLTYHRTGPKHCGLIGRKVGGVSGFEFTPEMKNSTIIWSRETLNQFLKDPLEMIPGTSMGFSGIDSEFKRKQLIDYIATLTTENILCR